MSIYPETGDVAGGRPVKGEALQLGVEKTGCRLQENREQQCTVKIAVIRCLSRIQSIMKVYILLTTGSRDYVPMVP